MTKAVFNWVREVQLRHEATLLGTYFSCWFAGYKSVSGRTRDSPPRHRYFLIYMWLKTNAEMVLKKPSCYWMFSCSPLDLWYLDPYFILMYMHNNHCHRVIAHLQLNILLLLLLLLMQYLEKKRTLVTTGYIWKRACLPLALKLLTSTIAAFPGNARNANFYFRVTFVSLR